VWEYQKAAKKNLVPINEQEQTPTALSCCLEGFFFDFLQTCQWHDSLLILQEIKVPPKEMARAKNWLQLAKIVQFCCELDGQAVKPGSTSI
jgi:hypothetical protein